MEHTLRTFWLRMPTIRVYLAQAAADRSGMPHQVTQALVLSLKHCHTCIAAGALSRRIGGFLAPGAQH